MFSYSPLKTPFQAALLAGWMSTTNKHNGNVEFIGDKRSSAATNRKGLTPGERKDERLSAALTCLGPYHQCLLSDRDRTGLYTVQGPVLTL